MKPRRTLRSLYIEIIKSRLADFAAWRMALSRPWRIDLIWIAIKFRFVNARRRRAALALVKRNMSPDWRDSCPKKTQRKLGLIPPINSHHSHANS